LAERGTLIYRLPRGAAYIDNKKLLLNEILEQPKNQRYGRVKKNSIIRTHQNLSLILLSK
jgi:hypothetical protein